ncbi:hypothetical protein T05_2785 [Trichinella murrelli]|uniref:Uncharacterized protein n=1 Tax=Trichinella murrelli TaxID=144512 RepID=A0A0V0TSN0_9BILA|nr:hypothetical protein T05_2785 [Trichinella murrelli]
MLVNNFNVSACLNFQQQEGDERWMPKNIFFGRNNFKLFHAIVCEANFSMLAYFPRNTDLMTDTNLRKEFINVKLKYNALEEMSKLN